MARILVVCPYPEGTAPSQRLKYEQYFDDWRAHGWQVDVSPFMVPRFYQHLYAPGRWLSKALGVLWGYLRRCRDLLRAGDYDVVYVHLWVTPLGPPVFERLLRIAAHRIVYDIDDMVFLGHASAANRSVSRLKGRTKPLYLMAQADHTIVCTPHLDRIAQEYTPNTTDISSTIDTDRYRPVNPYSNDRRLTIGWTGSHSTSRYLHLLDDVLRDLATELDFRLKVIGDPSFRMEGVDVQALPWSADREIAELQEIDIGLYPLPDEDWVLGKSGLKALQYMALGIPTVATLIGANTRVIDDGVSGLLVESAEAWKDAIRSLAADPALRERLGTAGRATVEEHFSLRANRPVYRGVLDSVRGGQPPHAPHSA